MLRHLSPEILSIIAGHLQGSSDRPVSPALAAFTLASRAFRKSADSLRLRNIHLTSLADLLAFENTLSAHSRDLGAALRHLVVRIRSAGKGKARDDGDASPPAAQDGPSQRLSATGLLGRVLRRARNLTTLEITVGPGVDLDLDQVVPTITSSSLRYLALQAPTPLNPALLAGFLSHQPSLTHLDLPTQHQPFPPEQSSPLPTRPVKVAEIRLDGRRKRLRLTIPTACPAPTRTPPPSPLPEKAELPCLKFIRAPVSFILSIPTSCPLQSVITTDEDIPRCVQRRFFEKLAQHGAVSGVALLRLDVTMSKCSMGLGVMQEMTRNLRDLEDIVIHGIVKDAYFTYFLQDLAGCIGRCRSLRSVAFESPARCAMTGLRYIGIPSSDPSIPLPPLASPNSTASHTYPPNGPDVFRREQYLVNLYGTANPSLRAVTMPGGTTWRWCHDEIEASPVDFSLPPLLFALSGMSRVDCSSTLPSIVVPSSPTAGDRHPSPTHSTAWGWEPDMACVEARAWWEECGLKPFHFSSPGHTAVDDDASYGSDDDDNTDVDFDDEEGETSLCFMSQWSVTPIPTSSEVLEPAKIVVGSSPGPIQSRPLKRRASDAFLR